MKKVILVHNSIKPHSHKWATGKKMRGGGCRPSTVFYSGVWQLSLKHQQKTKLSVIWVLNTMGPSVS